MSFRSKSRSGFSLIELLIVLGVIAVLLVAAFVVYPQVRRQQIVNKEVAAIAAAAAQLQSVYRPVGGRCVGASSQTLRSLNMFPGREINPVSNMFPSEVSGMGIQIVGNSVTNTVQFGYRVVDREMCFSFAAAAMSRFGVLIQGTKVTGFDDPRLASFCRGGFAPGVPLVISVDC